MQLSRDNIFSLVANVIALIALVVSGIATYQTSTWREIDIPFEVVPSTYDRYYEMNRIELEKPYLTHLIVLPQRYPGIVEQVKKSAASDEATKARYLLEERAVADFIFTYYEQVLFQTRALGQNDWSALACEVYEPRMRDLPPSDKRVEFVIRVLYYLRCNLLRNPRLVYWWLENGGGVETSYERATRDDWKRYIRRNGPEWCDPLGPFAIRVAADVKPEIGPTCD